jgi:hypothetical protein
VTWPRYGERAVELVRRIWPQQEKMPYAALSAVGRDDARHRAPGRQPGGILDLARYRDTDVVLGALVFTADRLRASSP